MKVKRVLAAAVVGAAAISSVSIDAPAAPPAECGAKPQDYVGTFKFEEILAETEDGSVSKASGELTLKDDRTFDNLAKYPIFTTSFKGKYKVISPGVLLLEGKAGQMPAKQKLKATCKQGESRVDTLNNNDQTYVRES
ncbi:hypothetical protein [Nocardia iowensis]|uniref:Uncharacterized protein n=1 Tax=Nocardia iowensis TaxID=204891 RepID=A0ABX8RZ64_NOCIO|nr:hypothetical protein [Nocardia iowensis]QXN94942.1 hypothetical protein KV110_18970 [Nocardia iowensis]